MLVQVMAAGVIVRVPATIGSEVPCHVDANGGRQRYRGAIDWRLTGGVAPTLMQVDVGSDRSAWVISALPGGFAATLVQVIAAGVIVRVPATIGSEVPCYVDASGGRQRYRGAIDWLLPGGFAATVPRGDRATAAGLRNEFARSRPDWAAAFPRAESR
jgi:alpha-galactosidase/6-phospho-beta-glucosidase family protein